MEISACVKYVGVNDHQVDLFEGQYKVPNGMSYNSYVILLYSIWNRIIPPVFRLF